MGEETTVCGVKVEVRMPSGWWGASAVEFVAEEGIDMIRVILSTEEVADLCTEKTPLLARLLLTRSLCDLQFLVLRIGFPSSALLESSSSHKKLLR